MGQEFDMKRYLGALLALLMLALAPATARAQATDATEWWQQGAEWPLRKPVTVDTTAQGLNLVGSVGRMPLLVRLHGGNFNFTEASDRGLDLRFIDSDGKTPLNYHIESWDPTAQIANVWVDAPGVSGGTRKTIYVYFGKKDAPSVLNTQGTFDADFTAVYHFAENQGLAPEDATAFKNQSAGTAGGMATGGAIGRAARFAGTPFAIQPQPANAVAAGAPFTVSAWVREDAPAENSVLVARPDGGFALGIAAGVPYATLGTTRVDAPAAIAAAKFTHLAVTSDGSKITLYVDGQAAGEAPVATPAMAGPITVGQFTGLLDELRISKVARPANVILADANGQGAQSKLVTLGAPQEQGSGGGVLGFVLKSIHTIDWFIIALCMLLLALAVGIMIWKGGYLARTKKGNAMFQRVYTSLAGQDLVGLEEMRLTPSQKKLLKDSSLARIYQNGILEVESREKLRGKERLSSETVEAIRSELDAQMTLENQKLDKWMVILTIAISGGPFIGLLGTVIGVMIVFGGVAMAGDVNVNAIAPGIAAALLATIAGLAAAIPSLFGYNYLNSQISSISDEMRVFVDRLTARLAETAAHHAEPGPPLKIAAE